MNERHLVPTKTGNVFADMESHLFQGSLTVILGATDDYI